MHRLIFAVLSTFLTSGALAAEYNLPEPTAENWRDFKPEICKPDSGDRLELRPVIFPPIFEFYMPKNPNEPSREILVFPARMNQDGNQIRQRMEVRTIPDMYHPETRRQLASYQFVGFLDKQDRFVDEKGLPIGDGISATKYPTPNPAYIPDNTEFVVSQIEIQSSSEKREHHRQHDEIYRTKIAKAENCSFAILRGHRPVYEQRILETQRNGTYVCSPGGGYEFMPPDVVDKTETRYAGAPDIQTRIYLKDDTGAILSGSNDLQMQRFNNIVMAERCHWQRVYLTPRKR